MDNFGRTELEIISFLPEMKFENLKLVKHFQKLFPLAGIPYLASRTCGRKIKSIGVTSQNKLVEIFRSCSGENRGFWQLK